MPRIAPFEVPAPVVIGEEPLTVAGVVDVARHGAPVRVAPAAFERVAASRALIERLIGVCNDVGLVAEEYDPVRKRLVGNFPQAFSHVALVNTILSYSRATGPARGAGAEAPR